MRLSQAHARRDPSTRARRTFAFSSLACSVVVLLVTLTAATPALAQSGAAHQQFLFAYRLLQARDDKLAAEAFDEFLAQFPRDEKRGDAIYYRALLARRMNNLKRAAELLDQELDPAIVPSHAVRLLRGQVRYDLGDYDKAVAALEPIQLEGLDATLQASVLYLRGLAYRGAGNLEAAKQQLERAGQSEAPLRAAARLDLARVQVLLDDRAGAVETLTRAIELDDRSVTPQAARLAGDLLFQAERYEAAERVYRVVLDGYQGSNEFGPALVGVMWSQFSAGAYDALLRTHRQYAAATPEDSAGAVAYLVGSTWHALGQHSKAVAAFEPHAARARDDAYGAKLLYKLAVSLYELEQYDEAMRRLLTLARVAPDSPLNDDAQFLMATIDATRGRPQRGAERLSAMIQRDPPHPYRTQALRQRARLYESAERHDAAAADYQALLEQPDLEASDRVALNLRLAALWRLLERHEEAAGAAQAVLDAEPAPSGEQMQEALMQLALARIKLRRFGPALEAIDRLIEEHPVSERLVEARYYRGLLKMTLGEQDEAVRELTAAAAGEGLAPGLRHNALRLVGIHLRQEDRAHDAAGVLRTLERAIGRENLKRDEQLWLGRYYQRRGESKLALHYLEPVIRDATTPESLRAEAMLYTGRALRSVGDTMSLKAAREAFRQVTAMGLGFGFRARLDLARTLADLGEIDEALSELRGLQVARDPAIAAAAHWEAAGLHQRRASTLRDRAEPTAAEAADAEAVKLLKRLVLLYGEEKGLAWPRLARIELAMRAEGEARAQAWRELAEAEPESAFGLYAKAMLALDVGDASAAHALLRQAIASPDADPLLVRRVERQLDRLDS